MTAQRKVDTAREFWLEQRRHGIGGSDAAAILGANPWSSAFEIWLDKTGRVKEKEPTRAMEWGLLLEDAIAQRYTDRTGLASWKPDRLYQHSDHPFMVATPDRLVVGDPDLGLQPRLVEIKTAGSYTEAEWGEEGTDQIPRQYLVQVAHNMAVLDVEVADVIVLIGGNDDRIFTVHRDRGFERILIARLWEWWDRFIVRGEEPKPDGSDGAAAWIRQLHPSDKGPRIDATEEAQQLGEALAGVKGRIRSLEAEETLLTTQLKAIVGDASGMNGNGWRVTWTGGRPKFDTDWKSVAGSLSTELESIGRGDLVAAALAGAQIQKTTPRAFRFTSDRQEGE